MLTFLSSPKPFVGLDKDNQYRAIKCWLLSAENVEVILFGDSYGIDEAGIDLGVKVVKNLEYSNSGIPLFESIVDYAAAYGNYDIQIFINCDILISNIPNVIKNISFTKFLAIGQRIDLASDIIIDTSSYNDIGLVKQLLNEGKSFLHSISGTDYFIFPRGFWYGISRIIPGRGGYDNALLFFCKTHHFPIIDCTFKIIALHQFHNYIHVEGGKNTVFNGIEAKNNKNLAGKYSLIHIGDSDFIFEKNLIKRNYCRGDFLRYLELKLRFEYRLRNFSFLIRILWRILKFLKLNKDMNYQLLYFLQKIG